MELLGMFLAVLAALLMRDWIRAWASKPWRVSWIAHPKQKKVQEFVRKVLV